MRDTEPVWTVPSSAGVDLASRHAKGADLYRNWIKRPLDIAIVVLCAPFWLPLIIVLALVVSSDGHSPFYGQLRLGRGGRVFRIWKLRSMTIDADARLEAYLEACPAARAEWDENQKLRHDPRVTLVGRVLRRGSLDELPQLWNVLMGDMSLVGPRPMLPNQASLYPGSAYYEVRPGITGLWQVKARNSSSFAARARFDLQYVQTLSFVQDIRLLLATAVVVFKGTGC
jgi:lipopolysaccharide/colanic/teichoic acid biosynthesis glycosyltransferase